MSETFSIYLDRITQEVLDAVPAATDKGTQHLKTVAVSKTPVESGNLAGLASVVPLPGGGSSVYYPGPYARAQHYRLDYRHEVGQALYLEQPLVQETATILAIMTTELRKALP